MSDAKEWVTVRVPKADRERAVDYKPEEATWSDCLVAGAERLNDALDSDDGTYLDLPAEGEILPEDAVDEIITELAEAVEPEQGYIDDDTVARAVAAKIDYAELARMTADELEERMR